MTHKITYECRECDTPCTFTNTDANPDSVPDACPYGGPGVIKWKEIARSTE
jgi:hypothetical protein